MHKTGTTTIQTSLSENRACLRREGIEYPLLISGMGGPRTAHHAVAHALAAPALRDRIRLLRFRRRIEMAARNAHLTVISAEPIYRHYIGPEPTDTAAFLKGHRAYLKRLAHFFRGFTPKVLLYLRCPDTYVVSSYKERVTKGAETPDFASFAKVQPWLVAYPERIAVFREVFASIDIRIYEIERAAGLLSRFYAELGLPLPPTDANLELRASPSNRATLWLRRAQSEAPRSRREHRFRVIFTMSPEGKTLFQEQNPSTLWPSDDVLKEFVARHRGAYEAGNFDVPDICGIPRTEWTNAMHAEAEEAFGEWENVNKEVLAERERTGTRYYEKR